jgi:phage gpG-like protein
MSAGLTITIRGTDQVLATLAKKPAQLRRAIGLGLRDGALVVLRRAQENLTGKVLNVDRGWLRQSMNVFSRVKDGIAGVGTNLVYAKIHEFGGRTQPHRIEARGSGNLAIAKTKLGASLLTMTKRGKVRKSSYNAGLLVFRRAVEHPGANMPARPYLRPALRESVPEIQGAIERQIDLVLKKATEPSE